MTANKAGSRVRVQEPPPGLGGDVSISGGPASAGEPTDSPPAMYESPIPLRKLRVRAAAVYCSDGRVGDQIDEFLHHILDTPLCDRLAIPGGPASMKFGSQFPEETKGVGEQFRFLVRSRSLQQVVLIAHAPCMFYRQRLQIPDSSQLARQEEDLREAARVVRSFAPLLVAAYTARIVKARVQFDSVSV